MKRVVLEYLVCPACQATLRCVVDEEKAGEIESGALACTGCDAVYPIIRGIPRFVTTEAPLQGQNEETADAFGWEWQEFRELHSIETYKAQFLDWIHPLKPSFFADKVILDAGCGMGRFSLISSQFGAKQVLAIDASDAVEAARENARPFDNVHVIQGDINRLPLRKAGNGQIDFAFSIGVLHHLDDPKAGFLSIVQHLTEGGSIFGWVYGRENNDWIVHGLNPVRTTLTSRLPRQVLYGVSWGITAVLHPALKFAYNPKGVLSFTRGFLPYRDYLTWLSQYSFRHNHHVVFDHLVAPVAFYISQEEFSSWFREADLQVVSMTWRNRNSWRGHGQKKA